MKDPKQIAIDFIKPYILRGDSVESIMAGQGSSSGGDYDVQLGGYVWNKDITMLLYKGKRHEVIVTEIDGKECLYIFNIHKLAQEIRMEAKGIHQVKLF